MRRRKAARCKEEPRTATEKKKTQQDTIMGHLSSIPALPYNREGKSDVDLEISRSSSQRHEQLFMHATEPDMHDP